ncbi:hypothetical protein CEXT_539461 [Caerostris extrusa]|uniref:Uncharacterized protein n=1 Tax=Caerostris extrusa TaxID=172846 RepID=A0AAV4RKM6_CAEEX|nr:hypothetical protein CEXT_539461 [Caerostris extrusa]
MDSAVVEIAERRRPLSPSARALHSESLIRHRPGRCPYQLGGQKNCKTLTSDAQNGRQLRQQHLRKRKIAPWKTCKPGAVCSNRIGRAFTLHPRKEINGAKNFWQAPKFYLFPDPILESHRSKTWRIFLCFHPVSPYSCTQATEYKRGSLLLLQYIDI